MVPDEMKFLISGTTNQAGGFAKQIITNQKKSCPILFILSNFFTTSRMGRDPSSPLALSSG